MHHLGYQLKGKFREIIISIEGLGPRWTSVVLAALASGGAVAWLAGCQSNTGSTAWPESQRATDGTMVLTSDDEGAFEEYMKKRRLVHVKRFVPDVKVELKYSTRDNITGKRLYSRSAPCLLDEETARKLAKAQKALKKEGFVLKVWDGYRPKSVQNELWKAAPKADFVVDPRLWYSKHSSGRAVDVTLVDVETGEEVKMPSDFDDFSKRARSFYIGPDQEIRENLLLLQKAMKDAGFRRINSEWWHFANEDYYNKNIPPFRREL